MAWHPCFCSSGEPCATPCYFCSESPLQFSVTFSGFTSDGCTDCNDLNATFVLTQTAPCAWSVKSCNFSMCDYGGSPWERVTVSLYYSPGSLLDFATCTSGEWTLLLYVTPSCATAGPNVSNNLCYNMPLVFLCGNLPTNCKTASSESFTYDISGGLWPEPVTGCLSFTDGLGCDPTLVSATVTAVGTATFPDSLCDWLDSGDAAGNFDTWSFTGMDEDNSDCGRLYGTYTASDSTPQTTLSLYSNSSRSTKVCEYSGDSTFGTLTLTESGGSGLSGSVNMSAISTPGAYNLEVWCDY